MAFITVYPLVAYMLPIGCVFPQLIGDQCQWMNATDWGSHSSCYCAIATLTPVCGVYPLVAYRLWKPIGDQWINAADWGYCYTSREQPGALNLCFGRGVRPGPHHPNPRLNQKFANVYPGVNKISVSIHYIYVAPNYI